MSVGKTIRKAYPFSNVVAAGDATSQVQIGKTINNLQLQLGGTALTAAMITLFRMKANAKTIYEATGTQISKMNAYRGMAANAAFLDVTFEDLTGLDVVDRNIGCLDTSIGIANLTTEVRIDGATAPVLTALVYETAPQKNVQGQQSPLAGLMAKVLRYPFNVSSGGLLPMNFPFGQRNGAIIKRIHVFHTGNMLDATIKENGVVLFEATKAQNEYEQVRQGRVPQTNVFTIDFMVDGDTRKAFDTTKSQSVECLLNFSAADYGFCVVEYLDTLGNL